MNMATEQIAVRLSAGQLADLDELVASGAYESRTAAVRAGIEAIAAAERRRTVDAAIAAGYRRLPPGAAEEITAIASLRDAIAQEPW